MFALSRSNLGYKLPILHREVGHGEPDIENVEFDEDGTIKIEFVTYRNTEQQ